MDAARRITKGCKGPAGGQFRASNRRSQSEFAQGWMVVGTASQGPAIFAAVLRDRQIVDAGDAQPHEAAFIELPIFIAVAAKPMPAVIVPLVGESHGNSVLAKRPDFLDEPVVEFARPFALEKRLDGLAALQEFGAVAPPAVGGVGQRDARRVARVPRVFGHAR